MSIGDLACCVSSIKKYIHISLNSRSRIHERAISLRFLCIILKVLRLEVSVDNVYIANRGGVKSFSRGDCE
jgi:hypothetical protein